MEKVDLINEIQDSSYLIKLYLDYFFDETSKRNVKNLSKENLEEFNKLLKNILKQLKHLT